MEAPIILGKRRKMYTPIPNTAISRPLGELTYFNEVTVAVPLSKAPAVEPMKRAVKPALSRA
jgi:hypothetical protein